MCELQTKMLDYFQEGLIGYLTIEQKIIYVTESTINILTIDGKKETVQIQGKHIVNFVVSKNREIAILYRQKMVEIRKIDRLQQIVKCVQGVQLTPKEDYPIIKLQNKELYLVYQTSIEIVYLKDNSRSKYTDLVHEHQFHKIQDILLLNLIETFSIAIIQLKNRLIVAIIPCTITELHIEFLSTMLCLHPSGEYLHPKTSYLVVLAEQTNLKVFDLVSLRQISQIQLPYYDCLIQIETDPNNQFLVVHYLNKQTKACVNNFVYKINTAVYYTQNRTHQNAPFILYRAQVNMHQYLTPIAFREDAKYHIFHLFYFRDGQIYFINKKIDKNFRQGEEQLQCLTDQTFWNVNLEWKQIIKTYMQLENQYSSKNSKRVNYQEEEQQLQEYYQIARNFDEIVAKFSAILEQKNKHKPLSQKEVEQVWENYMFSLAQEKNYRKQTMKLFKLDYKVVKQPFQQRNQIGIELKKVSNSTEGESRIDAKIKQKKRQIEEQKLKKQGQKMERPKLTEEQIKRQQDEYNRFAAQYLAQIQKKQTEDKIKRTQPRPLEDIDPQFKLELPRLNQEQRRLIQHKSLDLSRISSNQSRKEQQKIAQQMDPAWHQFVLILNQVEEQVSPLQLQLQKLIDKIDKIEHTSLQKIKQNEQKLSGQMEIDLQLQVKTCCKGLLSKMSKQIKEKMNESMQKLYRIQEKSIKQTQQSIQKFKQYAQLQVRHRVEIYHRSRRRMEMNAQIYAKNNDQQPYTES